jgi:hypothetical protein
MAYDMKKAMQESIDANEHNLARGLNFNPKWGDFSAKAWPDQRYNFADFNRGQKAYTINAYNRARINRGYHPIANPYSDASDIKHNSPTMTPPTPGKLKIFPEPEYYSGMRTQRWPSLIELLFDKQAKRKDLTPEEKDIYTNAQAFFYEIGDLTVADFGDNDFDPVPGTSGEKRPLVTDQGDAENQINSPPKAQKVDTAKRPADIVIEKPAKKPATMPLPGAALEENMHAKKAGSNYSGGFDSASGPIVQVARPLTLYKTGEIVFSKVIRFLTYGLGPSNLAIKPTNTNHRCIISSLAEIPWDRRFMYMNPGEFASLPVASFAKHASCSVVQRNPRVAFETGTTTSSLATLNQNKFGIKAIGLNKNKMIKGANRKVMTFDTDEPMIVTSVDDVAYTNYPTILYGYSQGSTQFDSNVPSQPFMIPVAVQNYWATYAYANSATIPISTNRQNPGWPDLSKHVTQFDMNATAGTEIINVNYDFNYCPLTNQLPAVSYIAGDAVYYQPQPKIAKVTAQVPTHTTDNPTTTEVDAVSINYAAYNPGTSLTELIDNSYYKGDNSRNQGFSRSIMPSVHVGISPVPRLTAQMAGGEIASWTDVQAYFEVKTTLVVGYHMDHSSTQFKSLHDIPENMKMGASAITGIDPANNPTQFGTWCNNLP